MTDPQGAGEPNFDFFAQARKLLIACAEIDPRDARWAEVHASKATLQASMRALRAFSPPQPADWELRTGDRIVGLPVRPDESVPYGELRLICETPLDASIRHAGARGQTINLVKPVAFMPPPADPPEPTLKALVRHWLRKVRGQ